jgi:NAD(P) transhydrogenase subunit alpha
MSVIGLLLALAWLYLRFGRGSVHTVASPPTVALLQHVTVFVMAVFVGFQVVWNVTPALHTPLMSVTNAISGIIVVGGLLGSQSELGGAGALSSSVAVAVVATLFATINIAGGFLVTRRMLAMFRK